MSIFAIGDVQGCYDPLMRLIEAVDFDESRDTLWFAGDLVNRGPASAQVLRFVKGLGSAAVTILGNHDLHLLAAASGARPPRPKDTFQETLSAPDRDELIDWLTRLSLVHRDPETGFAMVHAGIPAPWSWEETVVRAREVEAALQAPESAEFLSRMYGDEPRAWSPDLSVWDRLRFTTNALTRMRFCTLEGALEFASSGPPGTQPIAYQPWYQLPNRRSQNIPIVFGHWAALRLTEAECRATNCWHVDTGCVWGGCLTALCLNDLRFFRVSCAPN